MGFNYTNGNPIPATVWNAFLSSAGLYGASAAGSDAYAITVAPVPNDYDAGDTYVFKADVANTGPATLNVNTLGAKTIKKFGTLDLATGDIMAGQIITVRYDGTNFQMESAARPVPFFQQTIGIDDDTSGASGQMFFGSNSDGSVFYIHDVGTDRLRRFARDPLTGTYLRTHEVTVTEPVGGFTIGCIVQVGIYIYILTDTSSANMEGFRFLAADLTGQATLTIPAIASVTAVTAWTDGTDIYVVSQTTVTTSRRWTISGTTLTAAATYTVLDTLAPSTSQSTFFDGTNAYIVSDYDGQSYTIKKLTAVDGTAFTTTTYNRGEFDQGDYRGIGLIIDSTKMYIGVRSDNYNASAVDRVVIILIPITKP